MTKWTFTAETVSLMTRLPEMIVVPISRPSRSRIVRPRARRTFRIPIRNASRFREARMSVAKTTMAKMTRKTVAVAPSMEGLRDEFPVAHLHRPVAHRGDVDVVGHD